MILFWEIRFLGLGSCGRRKVSFFKYKLCGKYRCLFKLFFKRVVLLCVWYVGSYRDLRIIFNFLV